MRAYERRNRNPRNEAINRLLFLAEARSKRSWLYPTILAIWSLINIIYS